MTEDKIDHRELLLSLIASLTLCDHMGDVWDDVEIVLKKMKLEINDSDSEDDFPELIQKKLAKMGIKTVWGTSISEDEYD